MSDQDFIGRKAVVKIHKNGYYAGSYEGTVLNVKEHKIQVQTWKKGKRWYSKNNVFILEKKCTSDLTCECPKHKDLLFK